MDGFQLYPRQLTFGSQREIALYPVTKFLSLSSSSWLKLLLVLFLVSVSLVSSYAIAFLDLFLPLLHSFLNKEGTQYFCVHSSYYTSHSIRYVLEDIPDNLSSPEDHIYQPSNS